MTPASSRCFHASDPLLSAQGLVQAEYVAQMEVGIDGCRDLPQATGEGGGSAASHPNRHGRGLHLPGRDRVVQLERGVIHSRAYSRGEVTDDADDLVPAPGLHICARRLQLLSTYRMRRPRASPPKIR